jgi:large subunit ribosomal protein L15
MPLIRRLPKRGFNNARFSTEYSPVNLDALNQFADGATVDESSLRKAGLANGQVLPIKILGRGTLSKKLVVRASAFSTAAKEAIERLGGRVEATR